jgi:hypothetical protein
MGFTSLFKNISAMCIHRMGAQENFFCNLATAQTG